jgi:protein-S-isoprenylcysteine O-methyltransferase Ste14
MKKTFALSYGIVCYLAFFATMLYAIGFVGNLPVPKTIDGNPKVPLPLAILIDTLLLLLFGLQHRIMAMPAFKQCWAKFVPKHLERSTYILLASLCLLLMMWQWQPVGGLVWSIENGVAKNLLFITFFCGWFIVFFSTFLISHFDLFGLRQVWFYFNGKPYTQLPFGVQLFYKLVHHPLYLGFLIGLWSTPVMTATHLVFAIVATGYLTAIYTEADIGISLSEASIGKFEEKDLQALFERNTESFDAVYYC